MPAVVVCPGRHTGPGSRRLLRTDPTTRGLAPRTTIAAVPEAQIHSLQQKATSLKWGPF